MINKLSSVSVALDNKVQSLNVTMNMLLYMQLNQFFAQWMKLDEYFQNNEHWVTLHCCFCVV